MSYCDIHGPRCKGINDLESLFDLDVEVMKYLTFGIPSKRDEIEGYLEKMIQLLKMHQGKFGY